MIIASNDTAKEMMDVKLYMFLLLTTQSKWNCSLPVVVSSVISNKMTKLDCDYLPSPGSDVTCLHKTVHCKEPPIVNYSTFVTNSTQIGEYYLYDKVEYSCKEEFKLEGNKTIRCESSGLWSKPPQCSSITTFTMNFQSEIRVDSTSESTAEITTKLISESGTKSRNESRIKYETESRTDYRTESTTESVTESSTEYKTEYKTESTTELTFESTIESDSPSLKFIVLPILFVLLVTLLLIVRYNMKEKVNKTLDFNREQPQFDGSLEQRNTNTVASSDTILPVKRTRVFGAFVLYHFDSDDHFVVSYVLPELEEVRRFKLCIHSRNFTPGRDVKDNIEEAIEGSNSAIIVMSQGFVDSIWCKEEFTDCYIENMKDESFNLFVIMMQPEDTLVNISPYMKTFFANRTYLQVDDPDLFAKLAAHMENLR